MYAYNMFAHFRKLGKIIVRLRQEIVAAQSTVNIGLRYLPSPQTGGCIIFQQRAPCS